MPKMMCCYWSHRDTFGMCFQNANLLCSAPGFKVTYKDPINMIVYKTQNKHCMKHHCHEFQGKDNLKNYLVENMLGFEESDIE